MKVSCFLNINNDRVRQQHIVHAVKYTLRVARDDGTCKREWFLTGQNTVRTNIIQRSDINCLSRYNTKAIHQKLYNFLTEEDSKRSHQLAEDFGVERKYRKGD